MTEGPSGGLELIELEPAEYRIVIEHTPADAGIEYCARVYNLSGDHLKAEYAATSAEAERAARRWVELAATPQEPNREVWVDGAGRYAVAPTSASTSKGQG